MTSDGSDPDGPGKTNMRVRAEAQASPEEVPSDLVEISGTIKWFDVAKGYGFIVPDGGGPDILLHVTSLRRDGFQTAYEGARIVVEATARQRVSGRTRSSARNSASNESGPNRARWSIAKPAGSPPGSSSARS